MKRSDNFFDQTVKEKDYSSVIESLSVTTDQDNRDDFDSERRVRPPRDRSHLGITVRPVEGDGLALNEQVILAPLFSVWYGFIPAWVSKSRYEPLVLV